MSDNQNNLSKKELYQLKKEAKERQRQARNKKYRYLAKAKKWSQRLLIFGLIAAGAVWGVRYFLSATPGDFTIVSQNGLHWHPQITVEIKGQRQEIPAGIGFGGFESSAHTHESNGVVHLESSGLVSGKEVSVGRFFKVWGKTFNQDCIFDYCNGPDGRVRMFVNGKENFEFDKYAMKDGDRVVIKFE